MYRALIKAGWALNDIEDADFETLVEVVCDKKKPKKIELTDYLKLEKGISYN